MRRLLFIALVGLGFAPVSAPSAAPARDPACKQRCFQQKSDDYQRCRMIPPHNRGARTGCFIRADNALQRCLRGC